MKIYLVRFAKVYKSTNEESFFNKELDEIGKVQAEKTAKFFKSENISKIYIDKTIAGEKTAEIIKRVIKDDLIEEEIPLKKENEGFERVKLIYERIKKDKDNIIIISSSDFITSFILYVLGLSLGEKKYFRVKNCSISTIDLNEKREVIDFEINDCSHLLKPLT